MLDLFGLGVYTRGCTQETRSEWVAWHGFPAVKVPEFSDGLIRQCPRFLFRCRPRSIAHGTMF